MNSILLLFGLLLALVNGELPNVEIHLEDEIFFGSSSTEEAKSVQKQFGFSGETLPLLYPTNVSLQNGCTEFQQRISEVEFVVYFDRGDCTFNEKVQTAQALGAKSVIVGNQVSSVANETTLEVSNACAIDCGIAQSESLQKCEGASDCKSKICFDGFLSSEADERGFCCFLDDLLDMPVENSNDSLPSIEISAVFVGIATAEALEEALINNENNELSEDFHEISITIKERFKFFIDPSVIILLFFGTFSVGIASYIAAGEDRQIVSLAWGVLPERLRVAQEQQEQNLRGGAEQGEVEKVESVELSMYQAVVMLICATFFLVLMFFLVKLYPQEVVIGVIVLFALGAIYSTSYFFTRPVVRFILPKSKSLYLIYTPKFTRCILEDSYTVESLIGTFITIALVVVWFVYRHEREQVWILQNIFSVAVSLLFLASIRLNSLKTGFYLLVGFCIYDIFMVFFTPFFGGESVMLAVATAGAATEEVKSFESDNNVEIDFCERTEAEQMPMLFLAPRFDYRGGFGLLGLGDVLIPGIVMTYIIRTDYYFATAKIDRIMQEQKLKISEVGPNKFSLKLFLSSHYYFFSSVLAYFFALVLAFAANLSGVTLNGVEGQPALLYIVPIVLATFLIQLKKEKRDFLWERSLEDLLHGGDGFPNQRLQDDDDSSQKSEDAKQEITPVTI